MAKKQPPLKSEFSRAMRLMEGGHYRRALLQLEKLLPQAPTDPELGELVYLAMADAWLNLRQPGQTIQSALAALGLNPTSERAYYFLGFAHSRNAHWEQAIAALRQAVALNPTEAEYYRSLGWALYAQGQAKAEGQALLEKALTLAPTYLPILTDLAMLHAQEEQFEQALIYARRASELNPTDPLTQDVLAKIIHFKREFERLSKKRPQAKAPAKPKTEAEWRELIAVSDDYRQLIQLWIDLHPTDDIDVLNASLQKLNDLWNSTPRPELGGLSPKEMEQRK